MIDYLIALACLFATIWFITARSTRLISFLRHLVILLIIAFLFLGPSGAFHWNVRFGWFLPYLIISTEDPPNMYPYSIGQYGIRFSTMSAAINIFLLVASYAAYYWYISRRQKQLTATAAQQVAEPDREHVAQGGE